MYRTVLDADLRKLRHRDKHTNDGIRESKFPSTERLLYSTRLEQDRIAIPCDCKHKSKKDGADENTCHWCDWICVGSYMSSADSKY